MRRKDESRKVAIQEYVDKYFDEYSQIPSVRDIVAGTGIALATVHRYLVSMQESGELSYNGARNIGTSRIRKEAKMVSVPVLGRVSCGPGEWEEEDIIEYIRLPESFVGKGQFFVLIAKGESMIDADVHPGDYVVVRQQQTANDGDLVVALYDEGLSNLKKLAHKRSRAVLQSCNADKKKYPDISVSELNIQGVAVGVMHKFVESE